MCINLKLLQGKGNDYGMSVTLIEWFNFVIREKNLLSHTILRYLVKLF